MEYLVAFLYLFDKVFKKDFTFSAGAFKIGR